MSRTKIPWAKVIRDMEQLIYNSLRSAPGVLVHRTKEEQLLAICLVQTIDEFLQERITHYGLTPTPVEELEDNPRDIGVWNEKAGGNDET